MPADLSAAHAANDKKPPAPPGNSEAGKGNGIAQGISSGSQGARPPQGADLLTPLGSHEAGPSHGAGSQSTASTLNPGPSGQAEGKSNAESPKSWDKTVGDFVGKRAAALFGKPVGDFVSKTVADLFGKRNQTHYGQSTTPFFHPSPGAQGNASTAQGNKPTLQGKGGIMNSLNSLSTGKKLAVGAVAGIAVVETLQAIGGLSGNSENGSSSND